MISRRNFVSAAPALFASLTLGGCATPQAQAPIFKWGESVEFEGVKFEFNSIRMVSSFTNWINQRTNAADTFLIVDVSITNKTGNPLAHHFQPVFRLRDMSLAMYEPDMQKSMMINMQKAGRMPFGQNMNPNVSLKQEIVFEVPRQQYVLQVIVPNRARVGFAGGINSVGRFFVYDISSQLST